MPHFTHVGHISNGLTGTDDVDVWHDDEVGFRFVTNGSDYETIGRMLERFEPPKRSLVASGVVDVIGAPRIGPPFS